MLKECKYCKDGICVNADCPKWGDYCPVEDVPNMCKWAEQKAMTNYEKIKNMSIEKMTEFFSGDCIHCTHYTECCLFDEYPDELPCKAGALEWLESEVEE